jgi:hypothetical protein
MSHDSNEMTLTLKDGQPHLRAPKEGRSKQFKWIKGLLEELFILTGAKMGYSYFYGSSSHQSPLESLTMLPGRNQEEITVHLLGGANMSSDGTGKGGVTDHLGEVFTGSGDKVYEGLVCCDASVIPTALGMPDKESCIFLETDLLGVNPIATISALSERSLGLISKRAGLAIDFESKNDILKADSKPKVSRSHYDFQSSIRQNCKSISWQFTENLFGYFSDRPGDRDPSVSESVGRGSSCAMRVLATIEIWRQEKGNTLQNPSVLTDFDMPRSVRVTISRHMLRDGLVSGFIQSHTPDCQWSRRLFHTHF